MQGIHPSFPTTSRSLQWVTCHTPAANSLGLTPTGSPPPPPMQPFHNTNRLATYCCPTPQISNTMTTYMQPFTQASVRTACDLGCTLSCQVTMPGTFVQRRHMTMLPWVH